MFAVAFYGAMGGFIILGLLGAVAGAIASTVAGTDRRQAARLAVLFGLAEDLAAACALYVADLISPGL